jgi:hypothetical protein
MQAFESARAMVVTYRLYTRCRLALASRRQ